MTLTDSWPTADASGIPVADLRLINAGLLVKSTAGVPRLGVFPAHQNALVSGTANTSPPSFSVAAFVGAGSRTGGATAELVANDAATNVNTIAAPGSNSRIDIVWFRPQFTASSDANNVPAFGVANGTASGSPVAPALPAGAVELARATILSTTTRTDTGVTITQTAPYTAMAGGVVLLRSQTEQDAWLPADGGLAYRLDLDVFVYRENGAWAWEEVGSFTYGTFYGPHPTYDAPVLTRRGKKARFRGVITINQAVNFSANTDYVIGNVASGFRPAAANQPFRPAAISSASYHAGFIRISNNGDIIMAMTPGVTGSLANGWLIGFDFEYALP